MRSKNTMRKREYIWDSIYWTALVFLLYRDIFFYPVFALSDALSMVLLTASVIAGLVAGILVTCQRHRNYVSIFCNTILSFGPYFLVSFWNITRTPLILAGAAAVIAVLSYCGLLLVNYIGTKEKGSGRQWFRAGFFRSRALVSIVLALLLFATGLRPFFGLPLLGFQADAPDLSATGEEGETIAKNMDTVLLLQEDAWHNLDTAARLQVMKTIADIEANYLGIEPLAVCTDTLDADIMGHYTDADNAITLNLRHLSTADARTMLSTLCHECYHAYQYRLVALYDRMDEEAKELLLFQEASYYKDEFTNYIDGTQDLEGYSRQWCERDSESYAEKAVTDYYYRIYQYNEERKEGISQ